MHKCHYCKLVFLDGSTVPVDYDGLCPVCNSRLSECCENDTGSCGHSIVSGLKTCDKCGEFVCPECGNHDVTALSRVTGYYGPVDAYCNGKKQEVKDRVRYEV